MDETFPFGWTREDHQYESDSLNALRRAVTHARRIKQERDLAAAKFSEVVLHVHTSETYGQFLRRVQVEMINNGTFTSMADLPTPHEWQTAMDQLRRTEKNMLSKADQMFQEEMRTRGAEQETRAKLKLADDLMGVVAAMPNGAVVRFTKQFEGRDIDYGYVAMRAGGRWYLSHDSQSKVIHPSYNDTEFVTWLVTGKSVTEVIRMQDAPASAEISGELTDGASVK